MSITSPAVFPLREEFQGDMPYSTMSRYGFGKLYTRAVPASRANVGGYLDE